MPASNLLPLPPEFWNYGNAPLSLASLQVDGWNVLKHFFLSLDTLLFQFDNPSGKVNLICPFEAFVLLLIICERMLYRRFFNK